MGPDTSREYARSRLLHHQGEKENRNGFVQKRLTLSIEEVVHMYIWVTVIIIWNINNLLSYIYSKFI